MTNKIREMSWVEFDKRVKSGALCIVPTGAVEVYGPQCPLGTDTLTAEAMADMVAAKVNAVIAPTIDIGESSGLMSFPGTLTVSMDNYEHYMENVIQVLINRGFKNILFINGHAGNTSIINYLARKYQREAGVKCAQVDVWKFVEQLGDDVFEYSGRMAHGHAAESNTSIMLYLHPDLVDMSLAQRVDPVADPFGDIIKYREFNTATPIGVVGDPTVATAEKGEKIMKKCADRIVEFINNFY